MLGLALISADCGSGDPKPGTDTAVTAEVNSTEGQIQKAIADTINKSSLSTGPIALDKIEINNTLKFVKSFSDYDYLVKSTIPKFRSQERYYAI